jgi:hypothetical protein
MDQKPDTKSEKEVIFDKLSRLDIYIIMMFLLNLYAFNSYVMSVSVFAVRIVTAISEFIPFISFTYGVMFFLFLVNFYRFYASLNTSIYEERKDLLNSTIVSFFVIIVLNIIAEILISRIKF